AVFVPYAAPTDRLEVEITQTHKRFARAKLLHILEPSKDRTTPPCPYHFRRDEGRKYRDEGSMSRDESKSLLSRSSSLVPRPSSLVPLRWCGGCSWQHLAYDAQLRAKQALVQETLERLGGLKGVSVRPVLGMKDPWRYRNKVQQPVGWDGNQ